jgi:hypothetical protein
MSVLSGLMKHDKSYSNALGIFNPYKDSFDYRITKSMPEFDMQAYNAFPNHQFVYDKLFIAKSQNMKGGELNELANSSKGPDFPIFIKPRYGHKSASSKNCYKINRYADLGPHFAKREMMWSEFVDATESMTDFILVNGKIVYQLTYVYSDKQHGFSDAWKYISADNAPPSAIIDWVHRNMTGYTGPLNVQYRSDKIIEVGMRFARGGIYLESTDNATLINNINSFWKNKTWNYKADDLLGFNPYYSFKCWSPFPIVYLIPQHVLDIIMKTSGCKRFYEYYFEPTGNSNLVFFQFLHEDFNKGMIIKKTIEALMIFFHIVLLLLLLCGIALALNRYPLGRTLLLIFLLIYVTTLDNSLNIIHNQIVNQKQFL